MAAATFRDDIKVGSIGTTYDVPVFDDDQALENFDPSSAGTKRLLFKMPGATAILVRDASAIQKTVDGVDDVWCLRYTVVAADVVAFVDETTGGFHMEEGVIEIEPYLEFGPGQVWPGSTVKRDRRGRELRVKARLSV
jgi:hypothetical protein